MNILSGNHFSPLNPKLENPAAGGGLRVSQVPLSASGGRSGLGLRLAHPGRGPWSEGPWGVELLLVGRPQGADSSRRDPSPQGPRLALGEGGPVLGCGWAGGAGVQASGWLGGPVATIIPSKVLPKRTW